MNSFKQPNAFSGFMKLIFSSCLLLVSLNETFKHKSHNWLLSFVRLTFNQRNQRNQKRYLLTQLHLFCTDDSAWRFYCPYKPWTCINYQSLYFVYAGNECDLWADICTFSAWEITSSQTLPASYIGWKIWTSSEFLSVTFVFSKWMKPYAQAGWNIWCKMSADGWKQRAVEPRRRHE